MDLDPTRHDEFARVDQKVGSNLRDARLQDALVGMFPALLPSRKSCKKAIERGYILLNGTRADTARRVQPGDIVSFCPKQDATVPSRPHTLPNIHVVRPHHSDYALAWKPAGMATSGSGAMNFARTLLAQMRHGTPMQRQQLTPNHRDAGASPLPVHRLDRATSGWVCVALSLRAAQSLGAAFEARTITKRYLALVAGNLHESGSQTEALDGKAAVTHWTPLASGPLPVHGTATLLDVHIETGRTHQIRRHLASLGHPIVGEDQHAPNVQGEPNQRFTGHGLFLSAIHLGIPSGHHGQSAEVDGDPPKKFTRIRWIQRHFNSDASTAGL